MPNGWTLLWSPPAISIKEEPASRVQEAAAPKLVDTPASLQSRPKSELQASLLRPLVRETEAWEAGHSGLSRCSSLEPWIFCQKGAQAGLGGYLLCNPEGVAQVLWTPSAA